MAISGRSTAADGLHNRLETFALTNFKGLWQFAQQHPVLRRQVNKALINRAIYKIKTRPYPFSTMSPYTSWDSLTDRSYTGRHLPAVDSGQLPDLDEVLTLFARRPGQTILSSKSTLLFAYFAQWFTDGFLRTDRNNPLKNTSNHEIDLCQLYGLNPKATRLIRSLSGGRLKSQMINGEEYPCYLCTPAGEVKEEFRELPLAAPLDHVPAHLRPALFAMGGDRANVQIGYVMLNTLFLREHNRICVRLATDYPGWDDERLFQTTRNIMIAMVLKLVIEEYINHIAPYNFKFVFDTSMFTRERWYRQNWMTVEFNLVYRWHGMVPDHMMVGGRSYGAVETFTNSQLVVERGLGASFEDATLQPSGQIGALNTPEFLLYVERASIELGRQAELASYNDYREMAGFPRVTHVNQISGNPEVQAILKRLYGNVDNIEFYVGLFAEDGRPNSAVGPLIGRLVGIDAFSQALTNPLLAPNVFNAQTFSATGMDILKQTRRLSDIVHRNIADSSHSYRVAMTRHT